MFMQCPGLPCCKHAECTKVLCTVEYVAEHACASLSALQLDLIEISTTY